MRNSADDLHAQIESAQGVFASIRASVESVLGKRDELQIQVWRYILLHLFQRMDSQQSVVAYVDMRPDRKQPHSYRPIAVFHCAVANGVVGEQWLELAPQFDSFKQRAGSVDPRNALGKRCVHVEVGINERRRGKAARKLQHFDRIRIDVWLYRCDFLVGNSDVGFAPVRKRTAFDKDIESHLSPLMYGTISAFG